MEAVSRSLKSMEASFSGQLERRERVLKESRDVISACSRAIINVHTGKMKEAEKEHLAARSLLASLRKSSGSSASRYLVAPEAEYVEASAVISLAIDKEIPSMVTLGAPPYAYLLGLFDTVGEFKRMVIDSIFKRRMDKAM